MEYAHWYDRRQPRAAGRPAGRPADERRQRERQVVASRPGDKTGRRRRQVGRQAHKTEITTTTVAGGRGRRVVPSRAGLVQGGIGTAIREQKKKRPPLMVFDRITCGRHENAYEHTEPARRSAA